MSENTYFAEVFPVLTRDLPTLSAYAIQFSTAHDAHTTKLGGKLAYRLNNTYPGRWVWADYRILTDTPISPAQMDITLDILRQEVPELYGHLQGIEEDPRWQLTASAIAEYIKQTRVRHREVQIRESLSRFRLVMKNAIIEREPVFQTWVINDEPALSISIYSQLRYDRNLYHYSQTQASPDTLIGLDVLDKTSPTMRGRVVRISGRLAEHRQRLLSLTRREVMQQYLKEAPDDEWVVFIETEDNDYEYTASALHILIEPNNEDAIERFEIHRGQALKHLHLSPDMRATMVKSISDALKSDHIIDNAYNNRTHPHLFTEVDFVPNLLYNQKRVYAYKIKQIGADFLRGGMFKKHPRFESSPIRIAVVNTLDDIASDFVEASRRQLERDFGLTIELIRERRVRVLNAKNLESAVRVLEKEDPHLLLAFFQGAGEDENHDLNADYLKSLTLGRGIASHVVYEDVLHNPDAMPVVLMSLLAKVGNTPFVLAEPLEYTDYIVGLNVIRQPLSRGDRVASLARIYKSDGEFVRYAMEMIELDRDEPLPYIILQTLLPMHDFEGKRIIIHHDGILDKHLVRMFRRWAGAMRASIYPVEIMRPIIPRIYQLSKTITAPPWGTLFRLNSAEAFVIASDVIDTIAPKPLYLRSEAPQLPIELASYSVLAWTILHYGEVGTHQLPVTIHHDEDMRQWLARGILPQQTEGDVPFWL